MSYFAAELGPIRVIVLLPEDDETDGAWVQGASREWADELNDARGRISTL